MKLEHKPSIANPFLNLQDQNTRTELVGMLMRVQSQVLAEVRPAYNKLLTPLTQASQDGVDSLGWNTAGTWFRQSHNMIVPLAAMIGAGKSLALRKARVIIAQWHDSGFSQMDLAGTDVKASWKTQDAREAHMKIGAALFMEKFTPIYMKVMRVKEKAATRLLAPLAKFISVHDDPYLGKDFTEKKHEAFRSDDRCFVPSFVSFVKDTIAMAQESNMDLHSMMVRRVSNFYDSLPDVPPQLVQYWTQTVSRDPQTTKSGKHIVNQMLLQREKDIADLLECKNPAQVEKVCKEAMLKEMRWLISEAS